MKELMSPVILRTRSNKFKQTKGILPIFNIYTYLYSARYSIVDDTESDEDSISDFSNLDMDGDVIMNEFKDSDGDVNMDASKDDDVNMEAESNTLDITMLEPKESGQNILSICDPLTNDARIIGDHTSKVLWMDPDPVQVPSYVKDAKCKSFVTQSFHLIYIIHSGIGHFSK
jgi:hypothetical protein